MRVVLVLAFALLLPAHADAAETFDHDGYRYTFTDDALPADFLATSLAVARAYWGRDAPAATWTVLRVDGQIGPTRLGVRGGFAQPATSRAFIPQPAAGPLAALACESVKHEYGHLLGLGHGDRQPGDRDSVMAANHSSVHEDCAQAFGMQIIPAIQRVRSSTSKSDRRWCRRNRVKCSAKYPSLAVDVLVSQAVAAH